MKSVRLIVMFLLSCVVSGYFFPVAFTFFPPSLNTKQVIGVIGILAYLIHCIRDRSVKMAGNVIYSAIWAIAFSIWCYFCSIANGTDDTTYASYFISFSVWLGGAYGVCALLKSFHGRCDLKLITDYLMFVCVAQCILALMIDNIPGFKLFVDSTFNQGQEFFDEVGRLYGIGAALDPAGIRFAAVLILIGYQISHNRNITDKKSTLAVYLTAFVFITIVGNMISRTTIVGTGMGLLYIFFFIGLSRRGLLNARQVRFYGVLLTLIVIAVAVCMILYRISPAFYYHIHFAFEGFFNLFETGRFSTGSTDKLNSVMWVWPKDFRTWIIGSGLFGNFVYATDVGYCRFTLYCGLIGLAIFSGFFIYNGFSVSRKFRDFSFMSLMLVSLTFVIWIKVATDIFLINALLFCIDGDFDEEGNELEPYVEPE